MGRQPSDKKDTFKDEEGTHLIKPVGKEERLRRANERKKQEKRRRQQAKGSRSSETGTEGRGLPSSSNQAQPEVGGPDEWSALDTGYADDDYPTEPVDSVILEYGKRVSTRAMKEAEFLTRKADFVRSYIRSQSGLAQDHDHSCHPQAKKDVMVTVVDLIDVQEKVFTICGCSPFDIQLLEANCMTSSMDNPGVSFTTRCLEFYRQLNLKGQLSSQVFSKTLNAILPAKKDLYRSFLQSFKWYRAIKSASEQTEKVQFSICPVCPPFDNIHLSLDACFGLRRRMKAGDSQSFIQDDTYCNPKTVFKFADATENQSASRDRSDCHDFQAEKQANRAYKSTDYLSEKGVMGLFCARHGFLLRMCDVFHGERFAYADYLLKDFLRGNGLTPEGMQQESRKIMLYYDIGCRYRPHLRNTELGDFPFIFLIPKFHVYAHGMSCLKEYHPASIKGAGHTEGETCERAWSYLGRFARITREMSSGNRFDQLSDAKTHYNYTLLSGSLKLMSKKLIHSGPTIVSAISTLDAYRGNMSQGDIERLIPSFSHLDAQQATDDNMSKSLKSLKKIESQLKATCIELVHLEGQTESQLGQKESKALRSVHQGVNRKANRLLNERKNHPLAVRIATIKDITNPFSHINNPDGRTIQARILDAFYLQQRAEEEKNYLNEELMTLIVWSTNVAKTLTERISMEDRGNTPGSRGMKTVLESRLPIFEQIIRCAGRALHPSQTIQQVIELYQNAVLAVAVEEDEEQSDSMDLLFEEILEDEAETLAEGNIEVGTYLDTEYCMV